MPVIAWLMVKYANLVLPWIYKLVLWLGGGYWFPEHVGLRVAIACIPIWGIACFIGKRLFSKTLVQQFDDEDARRLLKRAERAKAAQERIERQRDRDKKDDDGIAH